MGVLIPPKSGIWGKTRERQNQILTKTLKNKGKYIAYERESCISDERVSARTIIMNEGTPVNDNRCHLQGFLQCF